MKALRPVREGKSQLVQLNGFAKNQEFCIKAITQQNPQFFLVFYVFVNFRLIKYP